MTELSDATLVMLCRTGDKTAFSLLVSRHWAGLRRVLVAMLPNPTDADDLLQEAFLRAYLGMCQSPLRQR